MWIKKPIYSPVRITAETPEGKILWPALGQTSGPPWYVMETINDIPRAYLDPLWKWEWAPKRETNEN